MNNPSKVGSNATALVQLSSSLAKSPPVRSGKATIVTELLSRPKGATVSEISATTGWQPHSVRPFFSGLRKKRMPLVKEARKNGEPFYRLMPAATDSAHSMPVEPPASDAERPSEMGVGA